MAEAVGDEHPAAEVEEEGEYLVAPPGLFVVGIGRVDGDGAPPAAQAQREKTEQQAEGDRQHRAHDLGPEQVHPGRCGGQLHAASCNNGTDSR